MIETVALIMTTDCGKEFLIVGSDLWVHVAEEHPEVFHVSPNFSLKSVSSITMT